MTVYCTRPANPDCAHRTAAYRALYRGDVGFGFGGLLPDCPDAECPCCGARVLCNEDGVLDHRRESPACT